MKKKSAQMLGNSYAPKKLTPEIVREIRRLRTEEGKTYDSLAAAFEIHRSTVSAIILGHTWKHVV